MGVGSGCDEPLDPAARADPPGTHHSCGSDRRGGQRVTVASAPSPPFPRGSIRKGGTDRRGGGGSQSDSLESFGPPLPLWKHSTGGGVREIQAGGMLGAVTCQ